MRQLEIVMLGVWAQESGSLIRNGNRSLIRDESRSLIRDGSGSLTRDGRRWVGKVSKHWEIFQGWQTIW